MVLVADGEFTRRSLRTIGLTGSPDGIRKASASSEREAKRLDYGSVGSGGPSCHLGQMRRTGALWRATPTRQATPCPPCHPGQPRNAIPCKSPNPFRPRRQSLAPRNGVTIIPCKGWKGGTMASESRESEAILRRIEPLKGTNRRLTWVGLLDWYLLLL